MLQRIQTIYLFISVLILSLILFFPVFKFNSGEYVFNSISIEQISDNKTIEVVSTLPVLILSIIINLVTLFTIFLFKKRNLQMKFSIISILLIIGLYILIAVYRFFVIDFDITTTSYSFTLIIPIISLILIFLAYKGIKKDEELVKSVDRIR